MILAIDTSHGTELAVVGETTRYAESPNPRAHAEQLGVLMQELVAGGEQIDAVAVGTGPAPFTGLRAGLVAARVFSFARSIPVWGVPSLDVLARTAFDEELGGDEGLVTVVTDARRRELYSATYRANGPDDVERVSDFWVGPAQELEVPAGSLIVGPAVGMYPAVENGVEISIDVAVLARIARVRAASGAELPTDPLYLRRPDAKTIAERARG